MKTRTKTPEKERAAAPTTAPKNMLHKESYRKPVGLSSLRMVVGGLLLFGHKDNRVFWPFFEATLRQYLDLRYTSESGPEQPGAAKRGQRD